MRKLNLIVVFNKKLDKVLFCIRAKEPYKGMYNFVGGKVEEGETNDEAAYRELFEETGISKKDIELDHFMDLNYFKYENNLQVYYGILKHDVILVEEKNKLEWVTINNELLNIKKFAGNYNIPHIITQIKVYLKNGVGSNSLRCTCDNLIIRKVKYEDIEQIVDINIKDWKRVYKGIIDDEILDNLNRKEKIKKWREHYNIGNVIVAEENGTILGYCRYDDNVVYEKTDIDSEIIAIYVDCDKLGNGIGKKLLEYVKADLKNKNKDKMVIWCLEKNQNARKFYEKMGGNLLSKEKYFEIEGKKYKEVGYVYNIKDNE